MGAGGQHVRLAHRLRPDGRMLTTTGRAPGTSLRSTLKKSVGGQSPRVARSARADKRASHQNQLHPQRARRKSRQRRLGRPLKAHGSTMSTTLTLSRKGQIRRRASWPSLPTSCGPTRRRRSTRSSMSTRNVHKRCAELGFCPIPC
jgi:hypothetical protein